MQGLEKVRTTITGAPMGALVGGALGLFVAHKVNYNNHIMVVSFVMVGAVIGGTIGAKVKR